MESYLIVHDQANMILFQTVNIACEGRWFCEHSEDIEGWVAKFMSQPL